MGICRKTAHVCTDHGNDCLRTDGTQSGNLLDCIDCLLFLRLHVAVNVIIQMFDMDIQLSHVSPDLPIPDFLHPPLLQVIMQSCPCALFLRL